MRNERQAPSPRECLVGLACMLASWSAELPAQVWERLTNPEVSVQVRHAPQVVLKGVTKIAVLEFGGDRRCSPEFTARLTQMLAQNGAFEIVDRENINRLLQEQGFQSSGAVSADAAVKLGQLIGPAAVLSGRITRCSVASSGVLRDPETYKDRNGVVHIKYVRRATAHMTSSVSLIDLTTGRMHAGDLLDVTEAVETYAYDGAPEAPSEDDALSKMYESATMRMSPLLFPWSESVKVIIYDDDKCALKQSASQIKRGDMATAIATLETSVKSRCDGRNDNGLLAKVHHNMGIALVYSDRPEDGVMTLRQALALRNSRITDEAIVAAQRIIAQNNRTRLKEVNAITLGTSPSPATAAPVGMTNKDVLAMVKAKLPDAIILKRIKDTTCRFDVSTEALIAMKQAGASDGVMVAVSDAAASKCK